MEFEEEEWLRSEDEEVLDNEAASLLPRPTPLPPPPPPPGW